MNVVLYTAMFGGYDTVKQLPPEVVDATQGRCILYHDGRPGWARLASGWAPNSGGCEASEMPFTINGDRELIVPMLQHKWFKTHPSWNIGNDIVIWIDASIVVQPDFIEKCVAALGDDDWAMVKHPWRDCIYTEAEYSVTLPRYFSVADHMRAQTDYYRSIGHPEYWGLPATGVSVRRMTPAVIEMSHRWWLECLRWTHQDQVSLPVLRRHYEQEGRIRFNDNLGWEDGWSLLPHLK